MHADSWLVALVFGILAAVILPAANRHGLTWLSVLGFVFGAIAMLGLVRGFWTAYEKDRRRNSQTNDKAK